MRREECVLSMKCKIIRLLVGVLFVMACAISLAGCGGDKKEAPAAVPATTAAKTAPAQEEPIQSIFAKAKQSPGMTYDSVITMKGMTADSRTWVDQGKVKMEQNIQGRKFVMYFDGEVMYQYDPASNVAMMFPLKEMSEKRPAKPNPTDYTDQMAPNSMKVVESVMVDNVRCRVITYTMKDNDGTVKMWIREDYGIPVRTEMTGKDGEKVITENKNLKIGALPPETFKLPAGAQVKDMSEMMKQLPPKP
jgi:outer membrane lipoprotein-sorting protein